ncbi:bZIP transcription factor 44-like [Nicotiana tabacum]|uniref:BZIP transcription factor 44-like n=3 Tax=Nicotiana TaxID=4085 RepID=A0A1S3YL18_TOBAC|nr:PREDICTED: ocs element-binding factor 1-like [Nicotiana sylvestris]XP_016452795.1 PREDICTED: bZIP transcription factor 53-like [Nicotiana tabacum]
MTSSSSGDLMNERKRKRMVSNRESARRSRMRKQKHLYDMMSQVEQLKEENIKIITSINLATQNYATVEAENTVLRVQMMELNQRLHSLNDILSYINNNGTIFEDHNYPETFVNNPWNFMYQNQPIMASAHMLYHY